LRIHFHFFNSTKCPANSANLAGQIIFSQIIIPYLVDGTVPRCSLVIGGNSLLTPHPENMQRTLNQLRSKGQVRHGVQCASSLTQKIISSKAELPYLKFASLQFPVQQSSSRMLTFVGSEEGVQ
jgi:hypothetical protein